MLKKLFGIFMAATLVFAMGGCGDNTPKAEQLEVPSDLQEAAALFVEKYAAGEYEEARTMLAPQLYDYLPAKHMKKNWESLIQTFGKYDSHEFGYIKQEAEQEAVYEKVNFEKEELAFRLVFNDDNRLTSFTVGVYNEPPVLLENEEKMTLTSGIYQMDAVLTMPKTKDTKLPPAVILIGGSGATDLDSTVGPNKPFADIAHGLAEQGAAVFRYDKRTLIYGSASSTDISKFTVYDEYVEDVQSAVKMLRESGKVDPERIYLAGHSMGGMMIPRLNEEVPEAAGFIMLSANARRLEDLILYQNEYLLKQSGQYNEKQLKAAMKDVEKLVQDVKEAVPDGTGSFFNANEYYWYDLNQYDQLESVKKIEKPLLILQGESDYQVTMEDFGMWKEAVGDRENVTMKSYPNMNHLLMESDGSMSPQEYENEGTVMQQLIDDMAEFIS